MNIIAGLMMPEMNWAPKLASYSSSFVGANRSSTSRWRPNTFTSAWPVNASSTCALSAPVCCHWAMNCFCERLAICRVTSSDSGIVDERDQRQQRRDHEHHHEHADDRQHRREQLAQRLLQVWAMLSMSLVTRLSRSPRGWRST